MPRRTATSARSFSKGTARSRYSSGLLERIGPVRPERNSWPTKTVFPNTGRISNPFSPVLPKNSRGTLPPPRPRNSVGDSSPKRSGSSDSTGIPNSSTRTALTPDRPTSRIPRLRQSSPRISGNSKASRRRGGTCSFPYSTVPAASCRGTWETFRRPRESLSPSWKGCRAPKSKTGRPFRKRATAQANTPWFLFRKGRISPRANFSNLSFPRTRKLPFRPIRSAERPRAWERRNEKPGSYRPISIPTTAFPD